MKLNRMDTALSRRNAMALGGAGALAATLAACSRSDGGSGASYNLRMSTQLSDSSPMVQGFQAWADAVAERTDGDLSIEIFPSGQLGSDEDVIEQEIGRAHV